MVLNKDYREFIELLNFHKVKYLIVGGYAVTVHGYPRYTNDIDIWLWIDNENAKKIINVLNDFGFGALGLKDEHFLSPDRIIQLGYAPNRIDLLTGVSGIEFKDCYPNKKSYDIEGLTIDFIDIDNLRKNKKASGRHKDLDDLENLKEAL
jgi:hypothetical protein